MENQDVGTDRDSLLTQFINITGAEESIAKNTLEASDWNLEFAINMFVDSNLAQTSNTDDSSPSNTINSMPNLSSSSQINHDDVRPPIPPVRQVLVEDYPRHGGFANTSFDAFRNFQQESRWQEQQLNQDPSEQQSTTQNRRKTLDDIFRPPLDLIFRGSFEMAKFEGQRTNKWLMVNIQNPQEFACQVLNRDLWSHAAVKSIINERFVFWQVNHDSPQGQNFMSFYGVHSFPHISIIDPRTGEKVLTLYEMDPNTFCEKVSQFLSDHPTPTGQSHDCDPGSSKSYGSSSNAKYSRASYDDNEQKQLEAAIKASLEDMGASHSSSQQSGSSSNSKPENWRDYLGTNESNKMELIIRYPDGNKEKVMFPSDSKLKALFLYVTEHGYSMNEYDLITNFPKKNLSSCEAKATAAETTLEKAGIHSRDTLYVQTKN